MPAKSTAKRFSAPKPTPGGSRAVRSSGPVVESPDAVPHDYIGYEGPAAEGAAVALMRRSLIFNLVTLTNKVTSASSRILLSRFGVGSASARVMRVLRLEPDCLPSRMCEVTTMDKSIVSRTLNVLEGQGYVRRRTDPKDPRRQLWSLTPDGDALLEAILISAEERQQLLLQGMNEAEIVALFSLLGRLQDNVQLLLGHTPEGRPALRGGKVTPKSRG